MRTGPVLDWCIEHSDTPSLWIATELAWCGQTLQMPQTACPNCRHAALLLAASHAGVRFRRASTAHWDLTRLLSNESGVLDYNPERGYNL